MEQELNKLNWEHQFDTFITYWKKIGYYTIYVSKHTKETKWNVTLIEWWDGNQSNEITINHNANFKWLMDLVQILSIAKN
jgi:hypothetical protein